MNIKKQISRLYFYEIISGLKIVDAVWVFFLLQRGFSLAQAGIAEGVFHLVSMCFEIPSGMVSDTAGRRNTLMLAGIVAAGASALMLVPGGFPLVLVSMGLNAISYNLVSGTREALTYDSLLEAGEEERYLLVASRQQFLYDGIFACSSLLSMVTVKLGWRTAYGLSAVCGCLCVYAAFLLKEPEVGKKREKTGIREAIRITGSHFTRTVAFLKVSRQVTGRMLFQGYLSSVIYIGYMFLQEHLVTAGLKPDFLGIPLLLVSFCGMAGSLVAPKAGGVPFRVLYLAAGLVTGAAVAVSGSRNLAVILLGAGTAMGCGEFLTLHTEAENQKEFSSQSRATMISAGSMVYSIFMTVLSPLSGVLADWISVPGTFCLLGVLTAVVSVLASRRAAMEVKKKK